MTSKPAFRKVNDTMSRTERESSTAKIVNTAAEILANETRLTRDSVKLTNAPDSGLRALMIY
ncbi:MAG: hypothetical protein ACHBMF_05260 [Chromatiales bacterium]